MRKVFTRFGLMALAIALLLFVLFQSSYIEADAALRRFSSLSAPQRDSMQMAPSDAEQADRFTTSRNQITGDSSPRLNEAGAYYANPLPQIPIPEDGSKAPVGAQPAPNNVRSSLQDGCFEYVANPGFETNGNWFGQPSSNVDTTTEAWNTGIRSVFLNTNFYSNPMLWQTIQLPATADSIALSFYSALRIPDPGEVVYVVIYDETFSELIYWDYLIYSSVNNWIFFNIPLLTEPLAGRTIQLTFQMGQDFDAFYSQVVVDDVSFVVCSGDDVDPPTPSPTPTNTPTPTLVPSGPKATSTPTLLPKATPTNTPIPPKPGQATIDLTVSGLQIGQVLMTDTDQVTGAPIPLIAEKPALIRVYIDQTGSGTLIDVDSSLFVRDAQGQTHTVQSLNGPIQLTGDSSDADAGSTLNFLADVAWLKGSVDFWAEVDPANLIPETNEGNNVSTEVARTFQAGKKLRIAWVEANQGVDRNIASTGDSDLRKFYPVGVNDVQYFFQPGFNQFLTEPLNVQSYPQYFNALNRFWDRMTHEGSWIGGTPPDRLYAWTGGQGTGLCGVADAAWVGGRGRVAVGYALQCGAETMAHEIGHILDGSGLRHSPNRPNQQDANCVGQPAGPEPNYPNYPNLPVGSIGYAGFDAARLQLLPADQHYDFMSYCEPSWISPFNYRRIAPGFAPAGATAALIREETETTKLMVSGLVTKDPAAVELDPFYLIRSNVAADAGTDGDYCIELRDSGNAVVGSHCFDLGFIEIESGEATNVDGFSMVVPYPQSTAKVVLIHKGTALASRTVSANQPFVRMTSPSGGGALPGTETINVTWNGADLDDDALHYSLHYSTDAGASWLPLATDLTGTSANVDLSTLPGSNRVQFRVGASDGINTAYATSGSFEIGFVADSTISVSGKPPAAVIRTEVDQVEPAEGLTLEGTGYDLEDGLLPEDQLRWRSNRDGDLGTGSWLRTMLSAGEHTITLTVTDSDGNTDANNHTVQVGREIQELYLPIVTK